MSESTSTRPSRLRIWLFRGAAVLLGLAPLLLLELACYVAGWGRVSDATDPYIEFTAIRPLFEHNAAAEQWEIPTSRQTYFRPDSFADQKPADLKRIFCLGGSTVQGRPWATETSFTAWLELSLQAAAPDQQWEVVNCGGVSYASYRLAPILDEVLQYQPDLIILYTGQNEFLEDRTYQAIKETPRWLAQSHHWLSHLRSYNVSRNWLWSRRAQSPSRSELPTEVAARLDFRGGYESYQRDDVWQDRVVEHYRRNLMRMIERAQAAGVPIVLVNPISNVKDSPPFKYEFDASLSDEDRERAQSAWQQAGQCEEWAERMRLLQTAYEIDPRHAGVLYQLGLAHLQQRDVQQALSLLLQAKDEDLCPLRMLEPMHQIVHDVCREYHVPLVDARSWFRSSSEDGIIGDRWMVDHVHPFQIGYQELAKLLFEQLVAMRFVQTQPDWESRRKMLFKRQLASLDQEYYERGRERLAGLRRWAQGRAWYAEPPPGHSRLED